MVSRVRKLINVSTQFFIYVADVFISHFYSLLGYEKFIGSYINGLSEKENNRYLVLFAHYDKDCWIDDHVLFYVQQLYNLGSDILFLSNSQRVYPNHLEKIKPYIRGLIIRKGPGRDFGSWYVGWKYALDKWDLNRYSHLILCNDSVYGPLGGYCHFRDIVNYLSQFDFAGITDSWEHCYHIQSYFMIFKKEVFLSQSFSDFFEKYRFLNLKQSIIKKYEIGLTQHLIKSGFKPGVLCNYYEVLNFILDKWPGRSNISPETRKLLELFPVNPSHFFWSILIDYFGMPFIKVELARDNPSRIPDVYRLYYLADNRSYSLDLIFNHLRRVKRV